MPDGLKYGLWALGALLLAALGVVLASNLALLFYGAHNGQIQTLTVFPMLTSANERAASAARLASMVVGGAALLAVIGIWNARNRQSLFGEARWATEREVRKAGLRSRGGLILGKFGGRYLNFGGQEHLFVSAPTRGGKGVGIVIPNLLNWPGSTIVLDVKKENWEITAGFRQKAGQSVHLFDPMDPEGRTARYNPLGYVNRRTRPSSTTTFNASPGCSSHRTRARAIPSGRTRHALRSSASPATSRKPMTSPSQWARSCARRALRASCV